MMKLIPFIACLLSACQVIGQSSTQQWVDYTIDAHLNPEENLLTAHLSITYFNNSKEALNEVYFHLWANALANKESAYSEQLINNGDREVYFSDTWEQAGYKEFRIREKGESDFQIRKAEHREIIKYDLKSPIMPGESRVFDGFYVLKIPPCKSRMGQSKTSFQMTQWYPKPAVYDEEGWHIMPYLELGEFYSEFGNFTVSITLPHDYVVAATGTLKTEEEKRIYNEMASTHKAYESTSSSKVKTLVFEAKNVHDFAWFADPNYKIRKSEAILNNGQSIPCYSFFIDENMWKNAHKYVARAVEFYSGEVGEYLYPHATAVESNGSTGGGMEYPMVTIIDPMPDTVMLDEVIAHEVGHNWFYGVLANNERRYPWLDEGFNSYIEAKYMQTYHPQYRSDVLKILANNSSASLMNLLYKVQTERGFEQKGILSSEKLNALNYGLSAYGKPAIALLNLEAYVGKEKMKLAMHDYYESWKFKHPSPLDVQASFEKSLNMSLDWLFDDILMDNGILDYAISSVKKRPEKWEISLQKMGDVVAPIKLDFLQGDSILFTKWTNKDVIEVESLKMENIEAVAIDHSEETLDLYSSNNYFYLNRALKKANTWNLQFFPNVSAPDKNTFYLYPAMGGNKYDGYTLGFHLSNKGFGPRKLTFNVTPMYGFRSKDIVGLANIDYGWHQRGEKIFHTNIGLSIKRFNYLETRLNEEDAEKSLVYNTIDPYIKFSKYTDLVKGISHSLKLSSHMIYAAYLDFSGGISMEKMEFDWYLNGDYSYIKEKVLHPLRIDLRAEYHPYNFEDSRDHYVKLTGALNQRFFYKANNAIDFRIFLGYFLTNTNREAYSFHNILAKGSFSSTYQGYSDEFDHLFFGRSESVGLWSRQVAIEDGGFKNALGSPFRGFGNSNNFMTAVNLSIDAPYDIPILNWFKLYADIGYFDQSHRENWEFSDGFIYSSGIKLSIIRNVFEIYLPLFNSANIDRQYLSRGQEGVLERISFSLDLNKINPYKWYREKPDFGGFLY